MRKQRGKPTSVEGHRTGWKSDDSSIKKHCDPQKQHQPYIEFFEYLRTLKTMTETPAESATHSKTCLPHQTRVSIGTAVALGLLEAKLDAAPTTAYLMTYHEGKCAANCGFCPQARTSKSKAELLSRVAWPAYPTRLVLNQLERAVSEAKVKRVCFQALNYNGVFGELCAFVKKLTSRVSVPVSVSCQPLNSRNMWLLVEAGVDRIGIALDAATPDLFDRVKGASAGGPYRWRDELLLLRVAIGVFGEGNVSTHLIVGLGETEREIALAVQECVNMGVLPALFAFTPIEGTAFGNKAQPRLNVYRRVQVARHLIVNELARAEDMRFSDDDSIVDFGVSKPLLISVVGSGKPFLTSGCPDCNRPFYNEKPSGPLYNFPRDVRVEELREIKRDLRLRKF
jgi:biotin synthase-related radical SAM superfamily protein